MNAHVPEPFRSILNTAAAVPIQAAQLAERAEKADARRFSDSSITGFGELSRRDAERAGLTDIDAPDDYPDGRDEEADLQEDMRRDMAARSAP